jgi:hypothetical protein
MSDDLFQSALWGVNGSKARMIRSSARASFAFLSSRLAPPDARPMTVQASRTGHIQTDLRFRLTMSSTCQQARARPFGVERNQNLFNLQLSSSSVASRGVASIDPRPNGVTRQAPDGLAILSSYNKIQPFSFP